MICYLGNSALGGAPVRLDDQIGRTEKHCDFILFYKTVEKNNMVFKIEIFDKLAVRNIIFIKLPGNYQLKPEFSKSCISKSP